MFLRYRKLWILGCQFQQNLRLDVNLRPLSIVYYSNNDVHLVLGGQLQHSLQQLEAHLLLTALGFELLQQLVRRPERHLLAVPGLGVHVAVHALEHLAAQGRVVRVEADLYHVVDAPLTPLIVTTSLQKSLVTIHLLHLDYLTLLNILRALFGLPEYHSNIPLQKLRPGSSVARVPTNSSDFWRYSGTSCQQFIIMS